jgi:hypothetical protein
MLLAVWAKRSPFENREISRAGGIRSGLAACAHTPVDDRNLLQFFATLGGSPFFFPAAGLAEKLALDAVERPDRSGQAASSACSFAHDREL